MDETPFITRDCERPKKIDFGWVKSLVLFFAAIGPKFTKFGTRVQE